MRGRSSKIIEPHEVGVEPDHLCGEPQDPVGSQSLGGRIVLTDQDVDDIVAYLKLRGGDR
jgi:hypothetical protein